jgi:hypothetical protein
MFSGCGVSRCAAALDAVKYNAQQSVSQLTASVAERFEATQARGAKQSQVRCRIVSRAWFAVVVSVWSTHCCISFQSMR